MNVRVTESLGRAKNNLMVFKSAVIHLCCWSAYSESWNRKRELDSKRLFRLASPHASKRSERSTRSFSITSPTSIFPRHATARLVCLFVKNATVYLYFFVWKYNSSAFYCVLTFYFHILIMFILQCDLVYLQCDELLLDEDCDARRRTLDSASLIGIDS